MMRASHINELHFGQDGRSISGGFEATILDKGMVHSLIPTPPTGSVQYALQPETVQIIIYIYRNITVIRLLRVMCLSHLVRWNAAGEGAPHCVSPCPAGLGLLKARISARLYGDQGTNADP